MRVWESIIDKYLEREERAYKDNLREEESNEIIELKSQEFVIVEDDLPF